MSTGDATVEWVTFESTANAFAVAARESGARVEWVTNEAIADALGVAAREGWTPDPQAMDDYGDAMFEPLTAIGIVVGVGWLINRLANVVDDVIHPGGQLIDLRSDPVVVRPLPKLKPAGKLVVVTKDGAKVFDPDRRDDGLAYVSSLLEAGRG